ncbi:MAG: BamA/TamA family outer membrane protein [Burkholderiales bacterium]|nr:BamA/TamA family outer membrane protein [Bacteroidia bacterium]
MTSSFLYAQKTLKFILATFAILSFVESNAQLKQDTNKRVQYLLIPVLFKTPETGLAYGLSGSISFKTTHKHDPLTRTSVIQTIGFFTTRRQNLQAIDGSIYFPKEKYILLFQISHSYFPDRFWGIGPSTNDLRGERYVYEQEYFYPHIKRKIRKHLFAGAQYEFQNVNHIAYLKAGRFDSAAFYGKQPYKVSGLGVSLSYDTRNLSFWPDRGVYLQTLSTIFRKELLSDYNVLKWITDLRYFKKIYKNHILAMQIYNYSTYGQTPLRELASFGGSNNMRGFYQGRYRDNNMISFITEYRLHIKGRFSACAFGGIGNVYNTYKDLLKTNPKYSYGAGVRLALLQKEKLNIRVDYGYSSRYNQGLYVTVGECF